MNIQLTKDLQLSSDHLGSLLGTPASIVTSTASLQAHVRLKLYIGFLTWRNGLMLRRAQV